MKSRGYAGMRFDSGLWGRPGLLAGIFLLSVFLLGGSMWFGFRLGSDVQRVEQTRFQGALRALLEQERRGLLEIRDRTEARLDALALRAGRMQAQVLRLDALGERVIEMVDLDAEEFNFADDPAMGGPETSDPMLGGREISELVGELEQLAREMGDRELKLQILEELLMNENLQASTYPAGRPVRKGWLSSKFGRRSDPFSGKQQLHKGIDFAGKAGSDVIAVAAGVVTKAEKNSGYGYLVEINHGNGYVTRYGHNSELLIEAGDHVEQGQTIARMGSSGRATGPHVHFEVIRNEKIVNPERYVVLKR